MKLLAQTSAFAWGLQFAFLNPALALLLSTQLRATDAQVGLALALYSASGFVASLLIPAWADRRGNYLSWMLVCGALTVALAAVLGFTGSLPVAIIALIVLGGPAGVGASLFFAQLRAAGLGRAQILSTRAMVSVSWVAGPPLAMVLASIAGVQSVIVAIVVVSTGGMVSILLLRRASPPAEPAASGPTEAAMPLSRTRVAGIMIAFVALQATNTVVTSAMALFTVNSLHLAPVWGGVALGVAALAEIPALLLLGRLTGKYSQITLIVVGCAVGVAYYVVMAIVRDPIGLVAAQLLNAWFFATVTGVGLTLFQDVIARPGLASGLFTNTRRIGAVLSGGIIALAASPAGFPGVFLSCAALTALALIITLIVGRSRPSLVQTAPETSE
ncbi:hypothetical protein LK09_04800 [Microbacterium mangrovi]|uniref:Major facilitator superfamily (MFS) profile domain-containing protein n=1 Tax=Microbacterium mangrovi TaxID=1348253 RepID=A0A0B2A637_9MICO|nr:hypothetical protein LK09_04800 [Microbacterium mangrovi]